MSHREPRHAGTWVCSTCGSRLRANAPLDPLFRPPCPTCKLGPTVPERRTGMRPPSAEPSSSTLDWPNA